MLTFEEKGHGEPLILLHGLGGSAHSWDLVVPELQKHRRLVVLNLPGHGGSPLTSGAATFDGMVAAVEMFLETQGVTSLDVVGSSLGGRIVLELARRGRGRSAIALDPGGFWHGWERHYVFASLMGTIKLIRALGNQRKILAKPGVRSVSIRQLSQKPSALTQPFVEQEIRSCAEASNFEDIVRDLTSIPPQMGRAAGNVRSVAIGWGRQDKLCFPGQAIRAQAAFPGSLLRWFDACGHFPIWDQPSLAAQFILECLDQERNSDEQRASMQQGI
ncbi:alpha/beta fold hydrolase [Agrobacterium vitis]|uniref:alpha/beta fold hydrolase n=1 Tax=Agrobacterium vitis TaxID=373 RepID=UPI0012E8F3AA|nr:alpha/beta fold hydrolase [Agrobacterium vitis]MVA37751.1 alpha/beta fold hydrolase [Agrobacterium vitis]MVA82259.1 alpha/beta fold hydrolase [Agrobacterium vitis]